MKLKELLRTQHKPRRIVRLVCFMLLCSWEFGHAYAQQISLNLTNATLKQVIEALTKQSGYTFFYDQKYLATAKPVTIQVKNQPFSEVMKAVFDEQPFIYDIVDETITLKPKKETTGIKPSIVQTQTVSGVVTDSLGNPMAGVSVRVKGTNRGTTTNSEGKFVLSDVKEGDLLTFSYIGSVAQEVPATRNLMKVVLKEDSDVLDEVVVVGFGTQKKINLTGAVSQVTSEVLESRPVANIGQALQGVIPNLNITNTSGSPNSMPSLNVRGGTSFYLDEGDNKYKFGMGSPLVLVDGIEADINQLNPEDIESISVLKDAASAAIYGARAAYGVMLVTTKKGKKGDRTKIEYSNSFQWNKPATIPDLLDAYTIQAASIRATEMQNQTPSSDALLKLEKIKAHMDDPLNNPMYFMDPGNNIIWVGNTNPYKEALKEYSPMMKHNLSLTGGSEKTSYYGAVGYMGQDGLYQINTDKYRRYNAILNINSQISDYLAIELRSSYNNSTYREPVSPSGKGGWWTALAQEPGRNINMPIKTPPYAPVPNAYTDNILSFMDYGSLNQEGKETIILGASPIITPLKGWKIRTDISYKSYNYNQKQVVPELERIETRWDATTNVHTNPNYVQRWKQHSNQYTINAYTDYNLVLGDHDFYGLVGYNQEWYTYDYLGGRGEAILSTDVPVIGQTLGNEYAYDNEEAWAIRGAFYRFTYNYKGRYLLESNGRYDGTSRFPKDRRFHFFPSFSGAWRISGEQFAQGMTSVVNDLKIRFSYGSLGNQNVNNYIYIPSYGTTAQVNYIFDGVRPVGITPPGIVDPGLTWETANTIDFGVDLTLFKKLDMTFDWYRRRTKDILVAGDKFPAVLGTAAPTRNSGVMQTKGWELTFAWKDILDNGLRYNLAFNLSDYRTELVQFNGNPNRIIQDGSNSYEALYAGKVMGEIWGYETAGIFQSQDQIDTAPSQNKISSGLWYPGDIQYKDLNGDGEISPGAATFSDHGDLKIIGNSTPRFQFGLNMNAFYKQFDINLMFQGVGKRDYWVGSNLFWGAIASGSGTWEVYEDSWTPENVDARYPAYKPKSANIQRQTRYLQNAAYIRLKNVSIGYTLPQRISRTIKIERLRVYGAAYNLWEYSKVPNVFDPEVLSTSYPMIRSFALGVQIGF